MKNLTDTATAVMVVANALADTHGQPSFRQAKHVVAELTRAGLLFPQVDAKGTDRTLDAPAQAQRDGR